MKDRFGVELSNLNLGFQSSQREANELTNSFTKYLTDYLRESKMSLCICGIYVPIYVVLCLCLCGIYVPVYVMLYLCMCGLISLYMWSYIAVCGLISLCMWFNVSVYVVLYLCVWVAMCMWSYVSLDVCGPVITLLIKVYNI